MTALVHRSSVNTRFACWAMWLLFLVLWSAALLTSYPLQARDAILPAEAAFPTGKLLHVGAYALFVLLTARLDLCRPWHWVMLGCISLHALGTEYLQHFVARTSSWLDVGFDHLGILLGMGLTWKHWSRKPI